MRITYYDLPTQLNNGYKIALLADLHSKTPRGLIDALEKEAPDLITVSGDLIDGRVKDAPSMLALLEALAKIAPTFYASGNHELFHVSDKEAVKKTGVTFLESEAVVFRELTVGGIASGFGFKKQSRTAKTPPPDLCFIEKFASFGGFKLLIAHHPEYYEAYIRDKAIDLVVSGHAHGGQWRFFGRGVFAPGQGLFPRYAEGVHDNRLVVSRGLGDHTFIPRLFNPHELVIIRLKGRD